uniref:Uncharacterized protein n=1 Tax=Anguilla anguilla TaxID=7936 RepID=A0A0E9QN20_ANGAN
MTRANESAFAQLGETEATGSVIISKLTLS